MESLYALPLMVKAVILGIVEGLTEFLPISSTGHLILTSSLLGWDDEKASVFAIAIQTGAILAVIWYYRERIGKVLAGLTSDRVQQRFALNIIIAFIPAAVLGVLFSKLIKTHLFGPVPVAIALVVGDMAVCRERSKENKGGEENLRGSAVTRDAVPGTGNEGRTTCRPPRISR